MSGGAEPSQPKEECVELEKVMKRFGVDEKVAADIILYGVEVAQAKFEKWVRNTEARRRNEDKQ
jgi:hypothetical protein